MTLISPVVINGLNISNFIAFRGLRWSYRYVMGDNGGLTLAGQTQLDVLATKADLEVDCVPLSFSDATSLLSVLAAEQVQVNYDDPVLGNVTKTMHPTDQSAGFLKEMTLPDGSFAAMWEDISFKLEEL